jgi:hypothetical protein
MTEALSTIEPATLSHRLPGRLRLRFPQLQGASERMKDLQFLVSEIPGVREVEVNAVSGSLLVWHGCEESALFESMLESAGVAIETALSSPAAAANGQPKGILDGVLTYRRFLGGGLLLMGVIQLLRGNVATPATTAFWYALTLLSQGSDEPIIPMGPED